MQTQTSSIPHLGTSILEELSGLTASIVKARPTFHVFRYRSRTLLYDLNTGSLVNISEIAYIVLSLLESKRPIEEIRDNTVIRDNEAALADLIDELRVLVSVGLFRLEEKPTLEQQEDATTALLEQPPRSQQILVQTSCNLKCTYCYEVNIGFHGTGKSMPKQVGIDAVELLLARSKARREVDINFFGGEPLLNFGLVKELVAYSDRRAADLNKVISYKMTTNGTLLNDDVIAFLIEHKFRVMISIDGSPAQSDVHRKDHAGRGVGEKVIANAKRLLEAQRRAGLKPAMIRATLTPQNPLADEAAEYFQKAGFPRAMIGASGGRAHEKQPWDFDAGSDKLLREATQLRLDRFLDSLEGTCPPLPNSLDFAPGLDRVKQALQSPGHKGVVGCGVGRNMTAVTEKGELYPCHRYAGDAAYKIGDLATGIDRQRLGNYYREIMDVYDKHCSGCWARYLCGGQCAWYISKPDGSVGTPDKEGCDRIREGSEMMLWLYSEVERRKQAADGLQQAPVDVEIAGKES